MTRLRTLAAPGLAAAVLLAATASRADSVMLLPARGQVPGKLVASSIEHETRQVLLAQGHELIAVTEVQAAVREVADGTPDDADEFATMARRTQSAWIVLPTISEAQGVYRLELTVFRADGGRTESVAREIDTNAVHQQVSEMAAVLIRPEGVGTGALPWEDGSPKLQTGAAAAPARSGATTPPSLHPLAGAGLGLSTAAKRPEGATGTSTSAWGALRVGLGIGESMEVAVAGRVHVSGPRATTVDASGRYTWALDPGGTVRVGPELGVGAFFQQGGAKDTHVLVRGNAVVQVKVAGPVSIDASVGDVTWVPASGGALVLAGVGVAGAARF